MGSQTNPTLVIVMIQERGFKSQSTNTGNQTRFKHKSHCVDDLVRPYIVPTSNGGLYNTKTP